MRWTSILASATVALAACGTAALHAQGAGVGPEAGGNADDGIILDMREAFRRGDRARLAALLPRAQGHPLQAWAAYWELKARLEDASEGEVQAFLDRHPGRYQEDRLRADWLLLAGKRRDWAAFAREWPRFRMADEPELRCYAVAMQLQQGQAPASAAIEAVRRDWLAERREGDGCLLAADQLHQKGLLSTQDLWLKARVSIEAGRAALARAAAALDAPEAAASIAQIHNGAARYLAGRSAVATRRGRELVVLALIRLATQDPAQAAAALEGKVSAPLDAVQRDWLWGVIGKQATLKLQDAAWGYFAKVARLASLDDDLLAWQARAALRAGQWAGVRAAIDAMGEAARQDATWVYWRARAERALARSQADRQRAQQGFEAIAAGGDFYAKLAREELGLPIAAPSAPAALTDEERAQARAHLGLHRALLAIGMGLRSEGVREWNYWTRLHEPGGMGERQLYAAADLACTYEVWDRCINTSEHIRGFSDFVQRFPMPHRAEVLRQAGAIALDPAYVYGLIRQESRFVMGARSHVGASGLMQVMPATARWTARRIGLTGFVPAMLDELDTNILIGTNYLKLALDEFRGSLPLAAAAYNAGPGRPRAWRNGPVLEGAIWTETIPFGETRDYVKKVLSNTTDYALLISGQPQSLKARLGSIGPAPAGETPIVRDMP